MAIEEAKRSARNTAMRTSSWQGMNADEHLRAVFEHRDKVERVRITAQDAAERRGVEQVVMIRCQANHADQRSPPSQKQ